MWVVFVFHAHLYSTGLRAAGCLAFEPAELFVPDQRTEHGVFEDTYFCHSAVSLIRAAPFTPRHAAMTIARCASARRQVSRHRTAVFAPARTLREQRVTMTYPS